MHFLLSVPCTLQMSKQPAYPQLETWRMLLKDGFCRIYLRSRPMVDSNTETGGDPQQKQFELQGKVSLKASSSHLRRQTLEVPPVCPLHLPSGEQKLCEWWKGPVLNMAPEVPITFACQTALAWECFELTEVVAVPTKGQTRGHVSQVGWLWHTGNLLQERKCINCRICTFPLTSHLPQS